MSFVGDPSELWRHIGKALWMAQLVEYSVVHFAVASRAPATLTEHDVEELLERQFKSTVGVVVGNLRQANLVSPALDAQLSAFVAERNWLAHRVRLQHALDIHSRSAFSALIARLEALQKSSLALADSLATALENWCIARGVSREALRVEVERLLAQRPGDQT